MLSFIYLSDASSKLESNSLDQLLATVITSLNYRLTEPINEKMPIKYLSRIPRAVSLLLVASLILGTTEAHSGKQELLAIYTQLKPMLEKNVYGIPVYVHSKDENDTMTGVIYGVLHHPIEAVKRSLGSAANWCEIAPQHLNIKACTYQSVKNFCQLTFYSGRKYYEKADDVYQLGYRFEINEQSKNFIHIGLSANDGPVGTSHYHLNVKAIPIDKSNSFIYFSYSYQYNFISSMGMGTYLATLGSGKVGFSVTDQNEQGKPVYINGVRGIIERNAVRYYLAIQSYLDTRHIPSDKQFNARINKWFDLTEKHHLQLYEMSKKDYLEYKQQERSDQLRLQQKSNQRTTKKYCR